MIRNLRLIYIHEALWRASAWVPVMVLLTRSRFGLDGAVTLSAAYYLLVVVLEVPSGWMSDRFGRVITLRVAASSFIAAHVCFLFGGDALPAFIAGSFFLAGGYSSLSGTDVSFHYDSLEAIDRQDEFAARQSRVSSRGFIASAVAAVSGGALGLIELRAPFVLALLIAVAQLLVTLQLTEPPRNDGAETSGIFTHVRDVASALRSRLLAWLFLYGVAMVTLEHIAFTPLQPWLTEALGESTTEVGSTPLLSGLVIAGVSVVGAVAARSAAALWRAIGLAPALILLGVLSAGIVTAMTLSTSLFVLGAVAFRSVQGAAAPVLLSAAIAPRIEQTHRATFLSLNSLGGRLGYGLILLTIARGIDDDLQPALQNFTLIAWIWVALLVVTALATPAVGKPLENR